MSDTDHVIFEDRVTAGGANIAPEGNIPTNIMVFCRFRKLLNYVIFDIILTLTCKF